MPHVKVLEHPVVKHKLSYLRDPQTPHWEFERILHEITLFVAVYASSQLPTSPVEMETPLEPCTAERLKQKITLVPILRAGLAMVPAAKHLFPQAKLGMFGLARDEETLQPSQYYENLPDKIQDDTVFVLDPMLATGGSAAHAIGLLKKRSVRDLSILSIIAAPEGIAAVHEKHPDVPIHTAALDRELNQKGYILPGLGDAGDRIFGNFAP